MDANKLELDISKILAGEQISIVRDAQIAIPPGFGVGKTAAVKVACQLCNADGHFVLQGQGECRIAAECSLCLEPLEFDINFQIMENYAEADVMTDDDFICITNKIIDLQPAIERGLFTNITMKPVCAIDCAGLCPNCGTKLDREQTDCSCGGAVNEHFSELLQLFNNEEV